MERARGCIDTSYWLEIPAITKKASNYVYQALPLRLSLVGCGVRARALCTRCGGASVRLLWELLRVRNPDYPFRRRWYRKRAYRTTAVAEQSGEFKKRTAL